MVTTTFGDVLVCSTPKSLEDFPSPESLKRKIVLSTKPPKQYLETKSSIKEDNGYIKEQKSSEESAWGKEIPNFVESLNLEEGSEHQEEDDHHHQDHNFQQNEPPEYKHLIAIRAEKMKGGLKAWLRVKSQKAHRVSLNEEKLEKAVITHGTDIVRLAQNLHLSYVKQIYCHNADFKGFGVSDLTTET